MRTVRTLLIEADQAQVERCLSTHGFVRQRDAPWLYPSAGTPVLYVEVSPYNCSDPDELSVVRRVVDAQPVLEVTADVSGRTAGEAEVQHFVRTLLSSFRGVAVDDYVDHAWRLREITGGHRVNGRAFFDYTRSDEGSRAGAVRAAAEQGDEADKA